MGKKATATMSYDAKPAAAYAMLTDPAYSEFKNKKTGGSNIEVSATANGSGVTIVAKRDLPADVPSFAKAFTGDVITTTETDTWGPAGADGGREAAMDIKFSVPAKVTGTMKLAPTKTGAIVTVTIEAVANIPFVAGKLEEVLLGQFVRAVEAEEKIGQAWLAKSK